MTPEELTRVIFDFVQENEFYVLSEVPDGGEIGTIEIDFYNGTCYLEEPTENTNDLLNLN